MDLLDKEATRRFFGGSKPISDATLYRGINAKRFPTPIKIGGSSRWLREECEAALQKIVAAQRSGAADEGA